MKKIILFSGLILLVLFVGCRERGVKGSGNLKTETRQIDDFDELAVSGAYNIEIEVGPETSCEISAEDNLLTYITTEVINGKLVIENSRSISPKRKIRITLQTPSLELIEGSGISNVYVSGIDERIFNLDLSGAGFIELYGKVEQFNAELSGAGRLEAIELFSRFVNIDASGASSAEIYVSESLVADLSGVGNIEYYGDPQDVKTNISGIGRIVRREY